MNDTNLEKDYEKKPTEVQLIAWRENDSVKDYFNQTAVRKFFNPYFKDGLEFQKVVQDISTAYYKNKDLQKCDKKQILQSVIDCLNLGLTIDKREHAYIVPRPYYKKDSKGNKVKDANGRFIVSGYTATLQIGYRGYIYKICQQYPDFNIDDLRFVRKDDEFSVNIVNGMKNINHKVANPFDSNVSNIIGAYCIVSYTKGSRICENAEFMSIEELGKIKNKSTMSSIWKEWFEEMAKKTIIRKICKVNFASITKKFDDYDNQFYNLDQKESKTSGLAKINEQ